MGFPPVVPNTYVQEMTYTTLADLTQPTPGTRRLNIAGSLDAVFAAVDAGNEPSGADFNIDVLINGSMVATAVIPDGQQEGLAALGSPVTIADGDLLSFDNIVDGGATGPVNVGLHILETVQ